MLLFKSKKAIIGYTICIFFVLNSIIPVKSQGGGGGAGIADGVAIVGLIFEVGKFIKELIESRPVNTVTIENHGKHHAHMWCASADDKIGGDEGKWLQPGESMAWSFRKHASTQFWCTMDWFGRPYGWDVFVTNWGGDHGKWLIRDDGIYEGGGNKRMDLESEVPVGENDRSSYETSSSDNNNGGFGSGSGGYGSGGYANGNDYNSGGYSGSYGATNLFRPSSGNQPNSYFYNPYNSGQFKGIFKGQWQSRKMSKNPKTIEIQNVSDLTKKLVMNRLPTKPKRR